MIFVLRTDFDKVVKLSSVSFFLGCTPNTKFCSSPFVLHTFIGNLKTPKYKGTKLKRYLGR
jgi:hypothetical protein